MPIQTDKEIDVSNRPGTSVFSYRKESNISLKTVKKPLKQYKDLVKNQESMENENNDCSEDYWCPWALQEGNLQKTSSKIPSNIIYDNRATENHPPWNCLHT